MVPLVLMDLLDPVLRRLAPNSHFSRLDQSPLATWRRIHSQKKIATYLQVSLKYLEYRLTMKPSIPSCCFLGDHNSTLVSRRYSAFLEYIHVRFLPDDLHDIEILSSVLYLILLIPRSWVISRFFASMLKVSDRLVGAAELKKLKK